MKLKVDIHIHSCNSYDCYMNVEDIIKKAKQEGLDVIAITDHDKVFMDEIKENDIKIVRGAEFSTEYGHLIGLFLKENIKKSDFKSMVDAIHKQGGIAILAHPFQHKKYENKLSEIASYIDGIEVWNSRANRKNENANKMALEFAKRYNLKFFAGSDAHIINEIGNTYFEINGNKERLRESLLIEPIKVYGKHTSSIYTAKSQYIKLKKLNKGKKNYVKWLLFYIKCFLEDMIRLKEKEYVIISEDR